MPEQAERRSIEVNGLRINYLDWGNPSAPPMVLVHGYTSSAESFNGFARNTRDRFHIVAPDVRGHGDSAWSPDGAYGYDEQVADLAAFVDALGLDRFTPVGTSMGGLIVMAYTTGHADRITRLVVNDIGPDIEARSHRITANAGARPTSFASLDEAIEHRRGMSANLARRTVEDQRELALGVLREGSDGHWTWKVDPLIISQRVQQGAPPRPALWPTLETLACPTMVVWGTASDVLSEEQAKRMVAALPHGELLPVPGVEHAPSLIEPEARAGLDAFLGR